MERAERIREIARRYYRQKAVQRALLETAKQREIVPLYFDSFGKRPDIIIYEGDIKSLADGGATSFHCSEERWQDPLKLRTELTKAELDALRVGWDFLIDIDCKFIDYSKVATSLLIKALHFHNIRDFGVKFSGGTGFHLAVASEAFPKEIFGIQLKDYFPDAARAILDYLKRMIEKELSSRILELDSLHELVEKTGKSEKELSVKGVKGAFNPYSIITLDSALISSRHLFRMPFSLNEKTSLASIVIPQRVVDKFNPRVAKPSDFITYRPFIIAPEKEDGRELLIQALDWKKKIPIVSKEKIVEIKGRVGEEDFPSCILKALEGIKKDGRKRALFILINFFRSINMPDEEIEKRLQEWNLRNYRPLPESYLKTQITWHLRQERKFPPPNCDNPVYKEIGIYTPECERMKNPLSYVARRLRLRMHAGRHVRSKNI